MEATILSIGAPEPTNSSFGNWIVSYSFEYKNGLKANSQEYFFKKKEALAYFNKLEIGKTITIK